MSMELPSDALAGGLRPQVGPPDPVEIVRLIWPSLIVTARAVATTRDLSEDLVQEALVQTLRRYPAFIGLDNPGAYMKTVLLRLAWKQRSAFTASEATVAELARAGPVSGPPASERPIADISLWRSLRGISRKQRACLYLRHVQDISDEQIAAILGCRKSTVRSQLARGAATLRAQAHADMGEGRV